MYKLLKEASLLTLVAFLLSACGGSLNEGNTDVAIDGPPPSREWQLVWSDEFEGSVLNPDYWNIQIGDGRAYGLTKWGNGEDQYYTDSPDNIRVEDGNMVITSLGDGVPMSEVDPVYGNPNTDYPFTSARVTTSQKIEFTYGRVEANIKIASTEGLWQAFWLLGSESSPYGSWPQRGEIDIMEAWKVGQNEIGGAVHFGTSGGRNQYVDKKAEVSYDDGEYHLYAVEWDAEEVRWYVDGKHFYTVTQKSYWNYYEDAVNGWMGYVDKNADEIDDNLEVNKYLEYQDATANAPFDQDQYIIFNTAVNGSLPDSAGLSADPNASYLGDMMVDYIRVYECPIDPLLPEGTGCKSYLDTDIDKPYYSNPRFRNDVEAEVQSFANFTDLYIDGPGPESILGNDFKFLVTDTASLVEVADPDNASNTYLYLESLGIIDSVIPTVAFSRANDDTSILAGFDGGVKASGDIKFDIYIERFDEEASNPLFYVGMANAPDQRKFTSLPFNDYAIGEWHRITVPIADIINGSGSKLNTKALSEVLRFMVNVDSAVRIDNVQFACGGLACGLIDEVPVFIDSVAPLWTRGIRGNDAEQKSSKFENPDYTENDQFHVQWEIIDTGEPGHDNVIQTTIGAGLSATDPLFPSEAVNFIGSINAISSIAALSEGEFRFDIRMLRNPNNVELYFKVDGSNSSTGGQLLTKSTSVGDWITYRCSIQNLKAQGLDVTTITAPFVMVPGLNGSGKDLTFQWDNVEFSPVQEGASPSLDLPIKFNEGGFCLPISPFAGGSFSLLNSPDTVGHPPSTETDDNGDSIDSNLEVGQTIKSDYGVTFGGITLNLENNIVFGDASSNVDKLFKLRAFTPRNPDAIYSNPADDGDTRRLGDMKVSFKLEAAPGKGQDVERVFTMTEQSQWEDITLDFNGQGEGEFNGITIIIDNGFRTNGLVDDWTLYFDNITQEDSTSVIANLSDSSNGDAAVYDFEVQDDVFYPSPSGVCGARAVITDDPEGVNGLVGKVLYDVIEPSCGKGVTFIGTDGGFSEPIPFADGRTTVSVDVYTDRAGAEVILKVEDTQDAFRAAELSAFTSSAGWSTITFDFSSVGIETNESFEKMMLIFEPLRCVRNPEFDEDCPNLPAKDVYYFDNITVVQP
jgi:beta-glucanase (GH16 family)